MKKLGLILSLGLLGANLHSQEFEFPRETDMFKFIPPGAAIAHAIKGTDFGEMEGVWYNKDCKVPEDYGKLLEKTGDIPDAEFFLDFDGDLIPDCSLSTLYESCNKYLWKIKLKEKLGESNL